jgi:hypothetical protein
VNRNEIEVCVDEIRAAHPDRDDFVRAIREFSETLGDEDREVLGRVLLEREPTTGGFDVLDRRIDEGGWIRRTMRKAETQDRRPPR